MPSGLTTLIKKEFTIELRKKTVIAGIGLYLTALIFVCYLAFNFGQTPVSAIIWSALFWLTLLFAVINTVAKSFIGEKKGLTIYTYTLATASTIILSKIVYNTLLCIGLSFTAFILFKLFLPTDTPDYLLLLCTLALCSMGFAGCLSLISAIAAKSNHSNVIMAVLSFPVIVGILLMAIRVTKNVLDQLERSTSYDELLNLLAIDAIMVALAYILFPYVWRS
jgi:heme exporter protein B